ncbi:hypothetical protein CPC08DRAFT_534563 [Agrocybe pediades]|nr:hypothetical protein CPC08DRAFT_534563 [Agrocybe pediades]
MKSPRCSVCVAEEAEAIEDGDHRLVNSPVAPLIEGTTFVLSETESTTFTQGVSYIESASSSEVLSSSNKWSEESVTNSTISSPFDGSCHGFQEKSDDTVANFAAGSEVGIILMEEVFQAIHDSGVCWSFEGLSAASETSSVLNDEVKEAREEASKEKSSFHDALRELASNHELRFEDIVNRMAMFKKNRKSRDVPTRDVHLEEKSQRCLVEQEISLYEMPSRTEVAYPNTIRPLITSPFPNPTPSRIPIRVGRDRALTRRGINGAVGGFTTGESADGHRKVQAPQGHDCGRDHRRRVSSTVSTSSSSARSFDVPTQEQYLAARRAGWRL